MSLTSPTTKASRQAALEKSGAVVAPGLKKLTVGSAIGLAVALGAAISGGLYGLTVLSCRHDHGWWSKFVCDPFTSSPPWTLLSGIAAAPCVLLTWYWRTVQRERELNVSELNHQVSDAQLSSTRFSSASTLLGHEAVQTRIGGLFALEAIARESKADLATATSTICAFIRLRDVTEGNPTDVAIALHILDQLQPAMNGAHVDLREASLEKLSLHQLHLPNVELTGASLANTRINIADFVDAKLEGSSFDFADIHVVMFNNCKCRHARFHRVTFEQCVFFKADLRQAVFTEAQLGLADLREADLSGANLTKAAWSAQSHWTGAKYDGHTVFPQGFDPDAVGMIRVS